MQPLLHGKGHGLRLVLPVPAAPPAVVDEQVPPASVVRHAHVVFQAVAARHGVLPVLPAEHVPDKGGDPAGVGGGAVPGHVEQHLPRDGKAPPTALLHPHGGAAHKLVVGGLAAVHLEDLVLLEEAGVAQVAHAAGEGPGAAGRHAPAVRGQAVKDVEILRVPQFAGVNVIPFTAPQPVFIHADPVQVRHGPRQGDGPRLRVVLGFVLFPVQGKDILIEVEAVAVLADLPYDGGLVVLRVRGAAGDGHRVPGLEEGVEVRRRHGDGVGLRVLLVELAVSEGGPSRRRGVAGLQTLEGVRRRVVHHLVREDDHPGAHAGEPLLPSGHGSLPLPLVVKAVPAHPVQPIQTPHTPRLADGLHQPPPPSGGQQPREVPRQVPHVVELPVPGLPGVVVAAEGGLHRLSDPVGVDHAGQPHGVSPSSFIFPSRAFFSASPAAASSCTALA